MTCFKEAGNRSRRELRQAIAPLGEIRMLQISIFRAGAYTPHT